MIQILSQFYPIGFFPYINYKFFRYYWKYFLIAIICFLLIIVDQLNIDHSLKH